MNEFETLELAKESPRTQLLINGYKALSLNVHDMLNSILPFYTPSDDVDDIREVLQKNVKLSSLQDEAGTTSSFCVVSSRRTCSTTFH
jgi:hypothetical protein